MSVEEHRARASSDPVRFAVLVVSTSRTLDDDRSGLRIAELLEQGGHEVQGRTLVGDRVGDIRSAVAGASEVDVVVLTGGTGLAPADVTPEAVEPMFARRIEGFGELFRVLSMEQVGSAAMLSRATAGVLRDGTVVFALPGSVKACELAVERLILPEVRHLVSIAGPPAHDAALATVDEVEPEPWEVVDAMLEDLEDELPTEEEPKPGASSSVYQLHDADKGGEPAEDTQDLGWMRAVAELGGEVLVGEREPLPIPIEKLSPVLNVLETAGEVAVLRLAGGERFSLWGWPDLRRPQSKVLAIGWGEPLAEVLALHRFPVPTGTCIEGSYGNLASSHEPVGPVCEKVTGRAPPDTSGQLFAMTGDVVWILRGNKVIRWDGRAERDDGNPKQVLATLILDWHAR